MLCRSRRQTSSELSPNIVAALAKHRHGSGHASLLRQHPTKAEGTKKENELIPKKNRDAVALLLKKCVSLPPY
jgi:hypothetical protein